ncbi:major facilitator superfamily domain-containing protein 6-like isoform X1 [Rhopalosiphum maidis]|uniref:major facilitator superfamily domain-containing protein 6-like isoform X1 n=2 Tax=Rhopalosiphum maidis TaxID=43146 RepID=UPI000F00F5D5|nr:major facilitator superfamily domain-containing protein 6-like isoform X1 [Rhopalosiphum maidis]
MIITANQNTTKVTRHDRRRLLTKDTNLEIKNCLSKMFSVNKRMLRIKFHYFLYMGGIASIVGFSPTIAKQMGYSPMLVGYLYTYLSILAFLVKPIIGLIVDKFPVKRITFLVFVLTCGLAAFVLNFIQKLPTETAAILSCNTTTVLDVCSNVDGQLPKCDDSLKKLIVNNSMSITCQLYCQPDKSFLDEICKSWSMDYCVPQYNTNTSNNLAHLNVSLSNNLRDQIENNYGFEVKSVQFKETQVFFPTCLKPVSTRCKIDCSNDVIMELATTTVFEGSIFGLHQFWEYFIVMSLFWISQAITWSLQDPICLDLLGTRLEDYGKQRCWGSISWGLFSVFGGALVDYFSDNDIHKNYLPIYYLCLLIILCDFMVAYKIKITETIGSKNTLSDIFKLITNMNIVVFFIWIILMGVCTSMVWNYLFWYMEDLTQKYHSENQLWIKTLQGSAIGIQCIGGEMPFLFFSGWIIKRIGHTNCMALGLFTFAIRFYLYSIITNPIWILPIEFTNGITFGLCHAVMMEYAKLVAPASAVTTVVGFSGALFEGVGISLGGLIGGFFYEKFGGVLTFKLFSCGSLLMGILHVLFIVFSKKNIKRIGVIN